MTIQTRVAGKELLDVVNWVQRWYNRALGYVIYPLFKYLSCECKHYLGRSQSVDLAYIYI